LINTRRSTQSQEVDNVTAKSKRVRRKLLHSHGLTPEGNTVVGGVFKLIDGQGVPISLVLEHFKQNNLVIDWQDLLQDVQTHGWNLGSFFTKMQEALREVYGPREGDVILERLKWLGW
jgi:hypothetical protein